MHEPHHSRVTKPRIDEARPRPEPLRFPRRAAGAADGPLPWIEVAPDAPYFVTEDGAPWHPIGQNDAVSWVEFAPLFRRRDPGVVEAHLARLAASGVTCLRFMLEYAQVRHRYIEKPAGRFAPHMVRMWDDLFALCERRGLRILLTPFDTFWTWLHFRHHPYNRANGGPLSHPSRTLLCAETRQAIKGRLSFAVERWGGSGALFAWDLWNEIHPAQAEDSPEPFAEFIADLSAHVRGLERRLYGRAHPQTVSMFGPELSWHPDMGMEAALFRHPDLDFANLHIYEQGTIDDPANTVDPAVGMGRIVRESLAEITDRRPFFDSEHGPIHRFKDHKHTLAEAFDDEYFRHMQWAHLAAGGAGGGLRWPNRKPHVLTAGMRAAQKAMADALPLIDWRTFDRRNINDEMVLLDEAGCTVATGGVARFGCASGDQALIYLLRRDALTSEGRVDDAATPIALRLSLPMLRAGSYRATAVDTRTGRGIWRGLSQSRESPSFVLPDLRSDLAIMIRGLPAG